MSATKGPRRRVVALPTSGMLPRVGKVRLGYMATSKSGSLYPKAADHFIVVEDESGITDANAAAAFKDFYGDEPRSLRCMLPGPNPEDVLEGAFKLYGTSKLKRRCDGAVCDERQPEGGWVEKPCVCQSLPEGHRDRCKLTFTLQVILPDVAGVGVWHVETGSEISSRRVADFLALIHPLRGTLALYEFQLDIVPVQVAPDGVSKTVWVLNPRATSSTPQQVLEGATLARRISASEVELPALPAPADETRDPLLHADSDAEPAEGSESLEESVARQIQALNSDGKAYVRDRFGAALRAASTTIVEEYGEAARDLVALIVALMAADEINGEVVPDDALFAEEHARVAGQEPS